MGEPGNPAQIELGGRRLVSLREKVRCDAIHLGAERPTAEALEHPAIRKIELEHCAPLALRRGGSRDDARGTKYYVAGGTGRDRPHMAFGRLRHIMSSDT